MGVCPNHFVSGIGPLYFVLTIKTHYAEYILGRPGWSKLRILRSCIGLYGHAADGLRKCWVNSGQALLLV